MEKNKKITISVIIGIVLLAVCVGISGSYVVAKAFSKQSKEKVKTEFKSANSVSEDISDTFKDYMRNMQLKIKSNWAPPKQETSKRVVLFYQIMKDGKIGTYKIIQSSGNKQTDKAAIKALKKSAPFDPLPESFNGEHIDVQFTFDYNVFKDNKK